MEKAIKTNGRDLRLASNQKLTSSKCFSTVIVLIGLKNRKNQNWIFFFFLRFSKIMNPEQKHFPDKEINCKIEKKVVFVSNLTGVGKCLEINQCPLI